MKIKHTSFPSTPAKNSQMGTLFFFTHADYYPGQSIATKKNIFGIANLLVVGLQNEDYT
jgi:hypothetical protein